MSRCATALIVLALVAYCPIVAAGTIEFEYDSRVTLSTEPAVPTIRRPVVVVLSSTSCIPYWITHSARSGKVIEVKLFVQDYCDYYLPPVLQRASLGVLPAGDYELRYRFCPSNPIPGEPGDPCPVLAVDHFSVGLHSPSAIPALGWPALALAALASLVLAILYFPHKSLRA